MTSMVQDFLDGAERVTARIFYYVPRKIGQGPLTLDTPIIGQKPLAIPHSGILQMFAVQDDEKPDVDKKLAEVFADTIMASGGLLKIQDRSQRLQIMSEAAQLEPQRQTVDGTLIQSKRGAQVPQIFIPTREEEMRPGMEDMRETFKAAVPFPKLRSLLQHWQANLDGPLNHVQYVCGSMVNAGYKQAHHIN